MASGTPKRTRSQRVAALALPPGFFQRLFTSLRQGDVLLRLALCALAAVIMWAATSAWAPPFAFWEGDVPTREIHARIDFEHDDLEATKEARKLARSLALAVYDQDPSLLKQLRHKLQNTVDSILAAESLDESTMDAWKGFESPPAPKTPKLTDAERTKQFEEFRKALQQDEGLNNFKSAIDDAFRPIEQWGVLDALPEKHEGNQEKILVQLQGSTGIEAEVPVGDVLRIGVESNLKKKLDEKLTSLEVANRIYTWLRPRLPNTLKINTEATRLSQEKAEQAVETVKKTYPADVLLAADGEPLDEKKIDLLRLEYDRILESETVAQQVRRSLATFGMYIALYTLCGFYIYLREPSLILSLPRFFSLLSLVVVTVVLCSMISGDPWRAEMIPLLLFGMTIAVAYHQELALLLSAAVALVVVLAIGHNIVDMVILSATVSSSILMLRSVRSRSKLLYVGMVSGIVAIATTLGISTLAGIAFDPLLLKNALRFGLWSVIAGSLMTCLLPFVEKMFDVQTDISLIELGDPAHPLLQELVRRAPGTYNHSITVASLAEAAAEAIGARSLLIRVGAYFHDIGKMLKPGYFVENQGQGDNRHESLVPAMSTLVIIAHVKDGTDLARQHHLPESIIDFIQQHHGTTLVEYFYRRASEQNEHDPDGGEVDESAFRYPGPKPQTKETGILMLADAVESASRVLEDPSPARIENLVEEIAMKRLMDGQFDECGLTLQEVRTIQDSLVKSLTAVYHGRVKYPEEQKRTKPQTA